MTYEMSLEVNNLKHSKHGGLCSTQNLYSGNLKTYLTTVLVSRLYGVDGMINERSSCFW
jgi:hypothetical protein